MPCCPFFSRCLAVLLLAAAVVVTTVSCSSSTTKSGSTAVTGQTTNAAKESDKMPKEPAPDMRDK